MLREEEERWRAGLDVVVGWVEEAGVSRMAEVEVELVFEAALAEYWARRAVSSRLRRLTWCSLASHHSIPFQRVRLEVFGMAH